MHKKAKVSLLGCILFLVAGIPLQAQEITVEGTVTTASGETLPGVNIMIKSTITGTATNVDGHYQIEVAANDTLVFSFVGFETKEVGVNGRGHIDVKLERKTDLLEELVVLGYTTQTKGEGISSVVQLSGEELTDVTTTSAVEALQGKAAGVFVTSDTGEPGEGTQVRIRGVGSISAGSDPLYVVDGVISSEGVAPSDVASMTVLKGASATALYGSRASNGVIVIRTKSGTPGETRITVSSTVGWNSRISGNFDLMNAQQLYEYHQKFGNPLNVTSEITSQSTNWVDLAYREAMTANYKVSASGGTEKTTFYISGNYYNEEGTLKANGYERFGGRVNIDHRFSEDFSVIAHLSGRYINEINDPTGAIYQSLTNMPWDQPYNAEGTVKTGKEPDWIGRDQANFLYPLQFNYDHENHKEVTANIRAEYNITDWLYLSSTNRINYETYRREIYSDRRTTAGSTNGGELYNRYWQYSSFLTSNLFNFDYTYGPHNFSGILGFEYEQKYADGINGTGIGIFSGLEILDVTASAFSINGYKTESKFVSGLSQLTYDYKSTYFLKLSYRRDGSSRFGANNRYGNFYSVGASWIISNEEFMEAVPQITNLKLRASYGTTGNASIGNYQWQSLYSYSLQYGGLPASRAVQVQNPNLTWEKARMTNVGINLGLFNRIHLTIDAYQKVTDDLLYNVILPGTTGFNSVIRNVGSIRNRGIEIALSTENIQGAFQWTTDFNISFNRNKVLLLKDGKDILNGLHRIIEGYDLRTWYMRKWAGVDPANGDPLWVKLVKDENGNVTSREVTNKYSEATLMPVGTATPDFIGGLRNVFRYKGWSLSTQFNFVSGNLIYNRTRELFDSDGAYATYNAMVLAEGWSRWDKPGDIATHPKPVAGGNKLSNKPSSRYLEDGSYIRLQNVTLAYSLPVTFISKAGLRSARIYVSGDNLLTLTGFSGMDPQVGVEGYAFVKYPNSKKYLIGIELGF